MELIECNALLGQNESGLCLAGVSYHLAKTTGNFRNCLENFLIPVEKIVKHSQKCIFTSFPDWTFAQFFLV